MNRSNTPEDIEKSLISRALRTSMKTELDRLIASKLATALRSGSLEKIRHTIEAFMVLDMEKREAGGFNEEDDELYFKIYVVAMSFINTLVIKDEAGIPMYIVSWPFPVDEAPNYLHFLSNTRHDIQGDLGEDPEDDGGFEYVDDSVDEEEHRPPNLPIKMDNEDENRLKRLLKPNHSSVSKSRDKSLSLAENIYYRNRDLYEKMGLKLEDIKYIIYVYRALEGGGINHVLYYRSLNQFILYAVKPVERLIGRLFKIIDPEVWDQTLAIVGQSTEKVSDWSMGSGGSSP